MCHVFTSTFVIPFRSSPLAGKWDTQLPNDDRQRVNRYAHQNGELIGPEAVKEGFLEREVLGSAEKVSAPFGPFPPLQ